jgi:hypothetical protein
MPPLRTILAALGLLAGGVPGLGARAQEVPPPAPRIVVQNLAPMPRDEWVVCVVPFARGDVAAAAAPGLHVDGHATVWQPFGARWADGSWRQARCMFRPALGPLEERQLPLVEGPGPELGEGGFGLAPHRLRFVAKVGGATFVGEPAPVELLEPGPARQVVVLRGRIGASGLVAEVTLEVFRGQGHAYCGIGVFFSDPGTTALTLEIEEIAVETEGLGLFFRHAQPSGIRSAVTALGSRHVLLAGTHLADGQGVRRAGVLLPPLEPGDADGLRLRNDTLRAAALCRPLAATDWSGSGAFGAFGFVPPPPPWLAQPAALRAAFGKQHAAFVAWSRSAAGEPLRGPRYGLAASAHQAGEQADFGVVALEHVAGTGIPSFLYEVEWSVLQEGCRPVHFFEADARPVRVADHPDWVVHNGRTHYHLATSPDRLGKTDPKARYDAHRWFGKDNQHWSSNYLGAYYLLTGDPQVLLEIRNEVQLYLGARTLRDGIWTSTPGAARAAGRTMLAATWLYLCTGDEVLLERMRRRMHDINLPHWQFRDADPATVRPFDVKGPDPRYFEGSSDPVWVPWEEALCVIGFAAYQELTDDRSPEIVALVDGLALNLLRHGWRVRGDGRAEVAYAMRILDGHRPAEGAELDDRRFVNWPKSSFGVWAMGALHVGRAAAVRAGDEAMVARADDLLRRLSAGRGPPRDGFYDRYSQWDGVRIRGGGAAAERR